MRTLHIIDYRKQARRKLEFFFTYFTKAFRFYVKYGKIYILPRLVNVTLMLYKIDDH